jgi:hypothetical protein
MITPCVKCGEALIAPDWSEFVSERLVVNLWSCTKCGDRFETKGVYACRCRIENERKRLEGDDSPAVGGVKRYWLGDWYRSNLIEEALRL